MREIAFDDIALSDEGNKNLHLKYFFLVEDKEPTFGIKISKLNEKNDELEVAKVILKSFSEIGVKNILNKIISGFVTPVFLEEIINEIFEEEKKQNLFSYEDLGSVCLKK